MACDVGQKLKRLKELESNKQQWQPLWQKVGEYIHMRKQDFTTSHSEGEFLNEELFDSTAVMANRKQTAAFIGNLWPNGGRSIRLKPPRGVTETEAVKAYYKEINEIVADEFDNPRAGFVLALEEYLNDQGAFGTSGVATLENTDEKNDASLLFRAWGVDECCIDEGPNGVVDTVYRVFEWDVKRVVASYGLEKLSKETQDKFNKRRYDEKVKILHVIEPRMINKDAKGNQAMPYESCHIEIDSQHLIRESGFEEFPAPFARFFKKRKETYGRSTGMDALPDILELDSLRESIIIATEKQLEPPLGIENDGILGSNTLDTSSGSINVLNLSGRVPSSSSPIFPLYSVGDIGTARERIEELKATINDHFSIDRLLDFNNETQMTLGEAQMRAGIRAQSLGSLFTRQINELFTPTIERGVAILFRKNKLGYMPNDPMLEEALLDDPYGTIQIPDEIAELIEKEKDFYEIVYETPAARMLKAEEAQGVIRTWEFAGSVGQVAPEIYDNLDADESLKIIGSANGAPSSIFMAMDKVKKTREMRDKQAQEAQQAQQEQEQLGQMNQMAQINNEMEPSQNAGQA